MTGYQKHLASCKDCKKCNLWKKRSRVVVARGKIPAEVLLIGEAPGVSEDALGRPFAGPAGHLLDFILQKAWGGRFTCCFTNLVYCIPLDESGDKVSKPPEKSVEACRPYLLNLTKLCKPRLVVTLGEVAEKNVPREVLHKREHTTIVHPAWITRLPDAGQRDLAIQRCVVTLADVVSDW